MEGLMQLFDRKYREYQDYLDEKSWRMRPLPSPTFWGSCIACGPYGTGRRRMQKQYHEEIVRRSHRIE